MISKSQLKRYRMMLEELSERQLPSGEDPNKAERELIREWRDFIPDRALGRQLSESYSNEELLEILRDAYRRNGRVPAKKDIFCFYRTYIKHRFVTWTAALKAAGLNRAFDSASSRMSDGDLMKLEREEPEIRRLLICLSERKLELGYAPCRKEFEASETLKKRFVCWSNALHAADSFDAWQNKAKTDADCSDSLSPEEETILQELQSKAAQLGRTPLKKEISEETRCRLRTRFGAWDSALQRVGLVPLEGEDLEKARWDAEQRLRGNGVIYHIENLEPEFQELLQEVKILSLKLGRPPLKSEFDEKKRKKLQARCGSWRNVLYQIDEAALSKQETAKVKQRKRQFTKMR
jgi:hypothetical protein